MSDDVVACPAWLRDYLNADQPSLISQSFLFADRLHRGQKRASGEPYIAHPVAVASILRDLGGSAPMIAAGFLHDVIEDTATTGDELEALFGKEVRLLVEGVTKLSKYNFENKTERQAENFRKMFLAMAQDIRVIVVKLADRLHNMRTLSHLKPEKRIAIARETRDIFAPLANRLGIGQIKWELEDLSFKYLEPEEFRWMQSLVADTRRRREAQIQEMIEILRQPFHGAGMEGVELSGRPKHLYGIYKKMERQQKEYKDIYDIQAIRVIVNTKEECYRALAIVHDRFRPIPGRFKDYIGLPKPNQYQSLHTAVIGIKGQPVEVQIRTLEMHHIAEYGIAAHWKYKESNQGIDATRKKDEEKVSWLRQLVDWQRELADAQLSDPREYLETVRENLFDNEVYVFSPKGDVYCLPAGATPVDFAFRIHTDIGNHCAGAIVNDVMVPLHRPLKSGDIVKILTQAQSHPTQDWLNFVATSTARNRIRQWLKQFHRQENIQLGRDQLERALGKVGLDQLLKSEQMQQLAEQCNYHTVDDLLSALGYGEVSIHALLNKLQDAAPPLEVKEYRPSAAGISRSPILGVEGIVHNIAGCCHPLPGEPIVGVVSLGSNRMIAIHRQDCNNATKMPPERLIPVAWNDRADPERPITYPVDIRVETIDRIGVFKDILTRLADNKINVRGGQVHTSSGKSAIIDLGLEITDRHQFERVCNQIRKMSDILSVCRVVTRES
ncbi:MAG: bifunctional (p)ppGpp synthetase/guanosine-3',5'-bis(diphosphate) 3'-pyrophosphohydrolase [Oscillatoriales cyanobacterium SM2_2_1]|nr:bifunctional (p)ppGpp synthetase/guanosine-3',5'-bis(diphosphate) 3'-pyrophosphohydrolase [Oscillatoriales cyanobacterium SM2_2_1]